MKRRILGLLVVLTLLLALPFGAAAEEAEPPAKRDVIVTKTSPNELTYRDADDNTFTVVDKETGEPVTGGNLRVEWKAEKVAGASERKVKDGAVSLRFSDFSNCTNQNITIKYRYLGNDTWNATEFVKETIIVRPKSLQNVTLTTNNTYALDAPVSGLNVTAVADSGVKKPNASVVTEDTQFGEKAYTVRVQLVVIPGYQLTEDTQVFLDDVKGTKVEDGLYEFTLKELLRIYKITYEMDGGNAPGEPTSYNKNSGTVTLPTNPTKAGFKFLGWTGEGIDADKPQTNVSFEAGVNPHDRTYTANWRELENYTVTFHNAQGHDSGNKEETVQENSTVTKPADPTEEGYVFKGWYTDETYAKEFDFSKPITGDTDIYAHWVELCTVSFNANGHSTATGMPKDLTVEAGTTITKPTPDPEDTGYVFKGWYTNNDLIEEFDFSKPIKENTTLYAKWAKTYTVTFNANGHGKAPDPQTVEEGAKATKPADPTEKGWRFDGWYTDTRYTTKYTFKEEVTEDIALYAKWTQMYTLTFETNGGTKIDSVEAPAGSLVYLGDYKPTKSGYYFAGWHTDKSLTQASRVSYVKMDGNKTVYAKFSVADKTNPKTADPAMPGLALAVLSFSGMGLAAMGFKKRK